LQNVFYISNQSYTYNIVLKLKILRVYVEEIIWLKQN